MCLAVPGRILEAEGTEALVDFQGNRLSVSIVLTPEAGPDDWVLVHAGFAIAKIEEQDARETWSYLNEMKESAMEEDASAPGILDGY